MLSWIGQAYTSVVNERVVFLPMSKREGHLWWGYIQIFLDGTLHGTMGKHGHPDAEYALRWAATLAEAFANDPTVRVD